MAVVSFALRDFIEYGFDEMKLREIIPKLGMEIESIKDKELSIDITPNRPDLLDFVGIARAIGCFSKPKEQPVYRINGESGIEVKVGSAVKDIRPYASCFVVKKANLKSDRLKNLINFTEKLASTYGRKRKKMAIGLHNLDAISGKALIYDAAAEKRFVPLGFKKSMDFNEIMKKHDKGIEYSDFAEFKKNPVYPYLEDSEKVLAMIPITNSEATKVTESTKSLLVFVDGTSEKIVKQVADMLACSFIDSNAEVYSCRVKYAKQAHTFPELSYQEIKVRCSRAEGTIGIEMENSQTALYARKMGYNAERFADYLNVKVQPYRVDVLNEQDVIEDIAMAYGYDRIAPVPVVGHSAGSEEDTTKRNERMSMLMLGLGFTEAMNMYLTNEKNNFDNMNRKYDKKSVLSLMNSKTEFISILRTSVLPSLLSNLSYSFKEKMPQRLFEIGFVFAMKEKVKEGINLAFVSEHAKANFSEAKSYVESIFSGTGFKISEHKDPSFIDGRCASVSVDGKTVGVFGEIHPSVLKNFKLEEPVVAAEIILDENIVYGV